MDETASGGGTMRIVGFVVFGIGAVVLIFMRGCVSLERRAAHAATAKYLKAQADFEEEWKDKKEDLQKKSRELNEELSELRKKRFGAGKRDDADEIDRRMKSLNEEVSKVEKELSTIRKDEAKEREELTSGSWKKLRNHRRETNLGVLSWEYICQWFLIPAALLMFVGLILLAKWGTRSESMLSLVMIGVIVYSLFVGGEMWADSLLDSAQRFGSRRL